MLLSDLMGNYLACDSEIESRLSHPDWDFRHYIENSELFIEMYKKEIGNKIVDPIRFTIMDGCPSLVGNNGYKVKYCTAAKNILDFLLLDESMGDEVKYENN